MPVGRFSPKIFPGAEFGMLTVIERIPGGKGKRAKIRCRCKCGNETLVDCSNLANINTKSCGCQKLKGILLSTQKKIGSGQYGTIQPGAVFGRLTVIERIWENGHPTEFAKCKCSCGIIKRVTIDSILVGNCVSCGCYKLEATIQRNKDTAKHGGFTVTHQLTYKTWRSLITRLSSDLRYINVCACKKLRESPFGIAEVLGHRTQLDQTLDRYPIHNGNYTCGECEECKSKGWEKNVRWATRKEQCLNRGKFNKPITAFGKTLPRSIWAELSGINEWRIHRRIKELGWTPEKALTTPDKKGNCYKPNDP